MKLSARTIIPTVLIAALIAWVVLWVSFTLRELFVKSNARDYAALFRRSLEGKHAYVTGEDLYRFIAFCRERVPAGSTYKMIGLEDGSIEKPRATYYAYPLIERDDPEYILAFKTAGLPRDGYVLYARFDDMSCILKKQRK